MKELIAIAALLFTAPTLALAQDGGHLYRGEGYVFIGVGTNSEANGLQCVGHTGGGGGVFVFKGLAVGSEIGTMGRPANGVGLFSIDPSYRLLSSTSKSKLVPFVDAGYTRTFGNDGFTHSDNLLNFGGGIYYWPFKRMGLRLDFRDYVDHSRVEISHFPAFRIGLAFR